MSEREVQGGTWQGVGLMAVTIDDRVYLVFDTGQILDAACTHEHHRVLLQVVALA